MAKLYFRYSAMNAGKTTQLLQVAHNYESRNLKVLVLKPAKDSKGGACLDSRLGVMRKVDHLIKQDENIYKYIERINDTIQCILIDESQFLDPIQVDQLMRIVVDFNIPIICYGLRTDFQTIGFPGSSRLLQIAHTIEELKTICFCGRKAIYNARKVNGKFVFKGEQIEIDNQDDIEYQSLCAHCYYEKYDKYLDFLKKTN